MRGTQMLLTQGGVQLNLKQFLLRREVLSQYRQFMRVLKDVKDLGHRRELRDFVRSDFERHRGESDTIRIRALMQHGEKGLKELEDTVRLSG